MPLSPEHIILQINLILYTTLSVISSAETDGLHQNMNTCKDELIKFYKHEMSKVQLLPWCDDVRDIDDIYVSLELEKQKYKGTSLLERNEDLVTLKTKEDMPATRVLVKGVAGSGKSTLLARLAYRWAQQSSDSPLSKYDLVFLIGLREVVRESSLIDVVFQQLLADDTKVLKHDLQEYIESYSHRILILLDGYDEYKSKNSTPDVKSINRILSFKMLRDCCVILSTRPYEYLGSHQSHYISVKLTGFSAANVNVYITKFFGGHNDMVEGLSRRLNKSEMLTSLSTIPVMLMLMCLLWEGEQKLPDTQSELYEEFVLYLWRRYCIKQGTEVDVEGDYGGEDFNNAILGLGRVALAGLCPKENIAEETIMFSETDLDKPLFHRGYLIGLLTKERLRSKLSRFSAVTFLHKSFQEFCAARYLASLFETNPDEFHGTLMQINTLDIFKSKMELLKFCCALVHNIGAIAIIHHGLCMYKKEFSGASPVVVGYDVDNDDEEFEDSVMHIAPIISLLYESQIPTNHQGSIELLKTQPEFDRFCKENTNFQQLTSISCFNEALESLFAGSVLTVCDNPPQTLPMFHYFVKSTFGLSSLAAVKSVHFNTIPGDLWDVINDTLECTSQVQKVHIDIPPIICLQPVYLRQFCIKLTRLVRLNEIWLGSQTSHGHIVEGVVVFDAHLTPEIVASFLDAIQSQIEKMTLRCIQVAEAIVHINHIMTPLLQTLELNNARLKEDHIRVLSEFLPKAPNLQDLDLSKNIVGMAIVQLAQQLQSCTKLSKLLLESTQLTDQVVNELAQEFVVLPNLTVLDISGNDVGNTGAHAVFKNLHHLIKLDELHITAHIDSQCSTLVKECVTAIGKSIPDTGFLDIDRRSIRPFKTDKIELICKIGINHK